MLGPLRVSPLKIVMYEALAVSSTFPQTDRNINLALENEMLITGSAHTRQKSYRKYVHAVCRVPQVKILLVLIASRGWSQN